MIPNRVIRILTAGSVSVALLVGLLIVVPISTLAATPTWESAGTTLLPSSVKPDANGKSVAGYALSIKNTGNSNISQLKVTAWFEQEYHSSTTVSLPPSNYSQAPKYAAVFVNQSLVTECALAAPVVCSVGSLGSNQTATLVVAYETTGILQAGVHAWWESTGGGSSFCDAADNSHGDCLAQNLAGPTFNGSNNYDGRFVLDYLEGAGLVANAPVNGSSNPQQVKVWSPAANIAVSVADSNQIVGDPGCPDGYTCVLQAGTAQIQVGNGSNEYGLIKFEVVYDKSLLTGLNFKKLTVLHILDDGTVVEITGSRSCDGSEQCVTLSNLPGGGGLLSGYLEENGFIKYH